MISILSNGFYLYVVFVCLLILFFLGLSSYQRKLSKIKYLFLDEQNKSFECGFDQFDKRYVGFCVQYIKTAFLFLIVDLEIALLVPLFVNTPFYEKKYLLRFTIVLLILAILLLMLIIEVLIGGLSWREDL